MLVDGVLGIEEGANRVYRECDRNPVLRRAVLQLLEIHAILFQPLMNGSKSDFRWLDELVNLFS